MAEAVLKVAVNTQELEKALGGFDKLEKSTKSAVAEMRKMEYAFMDAGKSITNVEKVTRQITDANGKWFKETDQVKNALLEQARALDSVAKATGRATVSANDSNASYKGAGGAIRNVSYQIQDFATQVGAGTSATTALGQQLPQLLSGFGLMGVVIGTATAVIIPLINSLNLFDSAASKASKAIDKFSQELEKSASLGDSLSKFTKQYSASSADGFRDYVEAYNKASASKRKEMDLELKALIVQKQFQLTDIQNEQQGVNALFNKNWQGSVISNAIKPKDPKRISELSILERKAQEDIARGEAALRGDFTTATQGAKATSEQKSQESLAQSYDRKVAAIRAEAETLQISNVEKKLAVELSGLEIDKVKLGTAEYLKQKDAITQAVIARNTAEEEKKLKSYTATQTEYNKIIELEGQRATMTAREYEKLVAQTQLKIQLDRDVIGMSPAGAEAYRTNAQALFEYNQQLRDANDAQKRTFGGGALAAINKYGEDASNIGTQVGNAFTNAFKGMEDAIISFTMTGKASFSSFAISVINDIQRILIRQALVAPIAGGISSMIGSLASSFAGAAAGSATSSFGSITAPSSSGSFGTLNSGVSQGIGIKVPTYDVGTNYVPNDQLAMIHKGEAIVPAAYNPAAGGTGGGNVNNVTVQVNMGESDKTTADTKDAAKLGALISSVVKATIIKEQRNGGLLSGT